jgi:SAM-dependent methyltransferase
MSSIELHISWATEAALAARHDDGSAGDADYGVVGRGYTEYRRPDPRIAAFISEALGDAGSILNVGAGAGSYEPADRRVTAVEPSAAMRAQRPANLPTAIDAVAENLPFPDDHFDRSMAIFTVHQWPDLEAGLREMRRVTRGPVLIMTCDPAELDLFWLDRYAPEVTAVEGSRYPSLATITGLLGPGAEMMSVPIPLDCADGFGEAYYGRPECLLEPGARRACSAWSFVDPSVVARFEDELRRDLQSGEWDLRYGHLRTQPEFRGSLKLIVGRR